MKVLGILSQPLNLSRWVSNLRKIRPLNNNPSRNTTMVKRAIGSRIPFAAYVGQDVPVSDIETVSKKHDDSVFERIMVTGLDVSDKVLAGRDFIRSNF